MLDGARSGGGAIVRHSGRWRVRQRGHHLFAGLLLCLAMIGAAGCQTAPAPQSPKEIPLQGVRSALSSRSTASATHKDPVGFYATLERGFNIFPTGPNAYSSSEMLKDFTDLRAIGVNAVTLTTQYVLATPQSNTISPGHFTVTDSSLETGIAWARQMGMRTTLALYVDPADGSWRARLAPTDRNLWFAQYGSILNHLADIAEQNHVNTLCIGVELISLSTATSNPDNTARWLALIKGVRARYHGQIMYAASYGGSLGFGDEYLHIAFWNAIDEVGIDAYYPVAIHADPTLTELENSWGRIHDTILVPFARKVKRPIVFSEVGYHSVPAVAMEPWHAATTYDGCAQAQAYFALLDSWKNSKLLMGIYWWYWITAPNVGGSGDTSYSPRGKPAQDVVASFWGGNTTLTTQTLAKMVQTCSTPP